MIRKILIASCICFIPICFGAVTGCNNKPADAGKGKEKGKGKEDKDEGHLDYGPHGGPCVEWGNEDFHAEFIVDAGKKQVTIYILDGTAKAAPKIAADKINVDLSIISVKPPVKVELKHDKDASSDKGIAFVGTNDAFAKPDGVKINVSGKVDGKPYSGDVEYKAPQKKTSQLYLTPGGIYTQADIDKNGNTTPDEKFKGKRFKHSDAALKPGDKICPITDKRANAECSWIVDGQSYEFCCRPCLDDFIERAHYDAGKIKKADKYVFKGGM